MKLAEHALTGHKVAIKILNRKKIKAMDMDEKGAKELPGLQLANGKSARESYAWEALHMRVGCEYFISPGCCISGPPQKQMQLWVL